MTLAHSGAKFTFLIKTNGQKVSFKECSLQPCWGNARCFASPKPVGLALPYCPHFSLAQKTQRKTQMATSPCEFCGHPDHMSFKQGRHIWAPLPKWGLPRELRALWATAHALSGFVCPSENSSPVTMDTATAARATRPRTRIQGLRDSHNPTYVWTRNQAEPTAVRGKEYSD